MVRKLNIFLILCIILFVFSGCKAFYEFNLFEGLDYVKMPSAEELNEKPPAEGLAYLEENLASDSFIDKLAEDQEAQDAVIAYLEDIYQAPAADVEPEEQVTAAVLAADVQLGVNGSDELVDNVFNAITAVQAMADGGDSAADQAAMQEIIESIIPVSVTELPPDEQEAAFSNIIEGLLAASDIYEELGNNLVVDPADPEADLINEDVTGGVLMNAAVAEVVDTFVTSMLEPAYQTPAEAAGVLWDVYQAALNEEDPSTVTGINTSGTIDIALEDMTYLQNIAFATGIDITTLF